jgi:formyltetrahydrofolate-dependent phosphoribosylglycinamide formyltransferase
MAAKLAVFISGSSTNLQALIDAIQQGALAAEIILVVSNRKAAYGLVRAEQAGIPTLYFQLKPYTDAGPKRAEYDTALMCLVHAYKPDLYVLVGWMHIFTPQVAEQLPNRIINLHPALLGAFEGKGSILRAYEAYPRRGRAWRLHGALRCTGGGCRLGNRASGCAN